MKKISVYMIAFFLAVSLCSCAVTDQVTPTAEPEETVQPPAAEEPPVLDAPGIGGCEPPEYELGNEPGMIAAGGYTVMDEAWGIDEKGKRQIDRTLYAGLSDGIYKGWEEGSFERICTDSASCMSLWEDRLYYICTFEKDGNVYEEIASVNTEGGDRIVHAPALPVEEKRVAEDKYDFGVNCTMKSGYTDLYVGEDTLFFIADNDRSGMKTISTQQSTAFGVRWDSGHSIYALDLNSGKRRTLVEEIGNGACRMNVADRGGIDSLSYTAVYDGGQEGAVQTLMYRLHGGSDPEYVEDAVLGMMISEEIVGFSNEQLGDEYFIGRGTEEKDALRIECTCTDETDPPWENMPGIAQPLIGWSEFFWLSGDKTEDGWDNVTLMRSHVDSREMQHEPVAVLGKVTQDSEFSRFSISNHVSALYLRTENALWRVGIYVDTDLVKLCETTDEG